MAPYLAKLATGCMAILTLTTLGAGIGGLLGAVMVIVNGQRDMEYAMILDEPESDFVFLGQVCNITSVRRCWRTIDGRCRNEYVARFKAPGAYNGYEETIWSSYPEVVDDANPDRECPAGCDTHDNLRFPSGRIQSGHVYDCWRPAGTAFELRYECGNDHCIKLSDPADLARHYENRARSVYMWGGILAVLGTIFCCVTSCLCSRLEKRCGLFSSTPTVNVVRTGTSTKAAAVAKPSVTTAQMAPSSPTLASESAASRV